MKHETAPETTPALVIGGGPAGLMAAEAMAGAGLRVIVAEAKPSFGRKLLMAGKSGLNLTKAEPPERFRAAFPHLPAQLAAALDAFGPDETRAWARGLGVETFVGSSGRVFPKEMKASPLLRAWLRRLAASGVDLRPRWRWTGFDGAAMVFDTPQGPRAATPATTILALGGASWPRLGSDGSWAPLLAGRGVVAAPLRAANMGFEIDWSEPMRGRFAGAPVKGVALSFGGRRLRGEFVITAYGIEGGGVYALSAPLREAIAADGSAVLTVDLLPDRAAADLARAWARPRGKASISTHLRKALRLDGAKAALLREAAPEALTGDGETLAAAVKALPLRLARPRPVAEAISTAGGVRFEDLDDGFAARAAPGLRFAGEMLDWEAPTGGYLLTACLATGRAAGLAAAADLLGAR